MRLTARSFENAAVHYLKRFPSSAENLRRVLWRKARRVEGFASADETELRQIIEDTVARLIAAGLLDDEAYARALANSLHRRGRPLRAVGARLREKGVPADVVKQSLDRLKEGDDDVDLTAAWSFARRKRLGPFRTDAEQRHEKRQKDLASLARAGFSYDIARRVIEAEEPLHR